MISRLLKICFALCLALYLLVAGCFAQTQTVMISNFGGINRDMPPSKNKTDCWECLNMDLSGGTLKIMPSSHLIRQDIQLTSGIFGYNSRSGSTLFGIKDYPNIGDELVCSGNDSFFVNDSLFPFISNPSLKYSVNNWLSWNGDIYYFNGRNIPIKIFGGHNNWKAEYLFPPAPGQPIVIPFDNWGEKVRGYCIYGFVAEIPCSTNHAWSSAATLSLPIYFPQNSAALIKGFMCQLPESFCSAPSTLDFLIVRTRTNHIDFHKDSLFIIANMTGLINSQPSLDTQYYGDGNNDEFCTPSNFWKTLADAEGSTTNMAQPCDVYNPRYALGSPTYMAYNPYPSVIDTILDKRKGETTATYVVIFADTLDGRVSGMSRPLRIKPKAADTIVTTILLRLPRAPAGLTDIIYRKINDGNYLSIDTIQSNSGIIGNWIAWEDYYGDDHLLGNDIYVENTPNVIFKGAIVHEGRMVAWDDNRVYLSKSDTAGQYLWVDNIDVESENDDIIQRCVSNDGYIEVLKTKSIWIIYTQDGQVYDRKNRAGGIGMIAPNSFAQYMGINFYLDREGVVMEQPSPNRSFFLTRKYISDPIKSMLVPNDSLAYAHGCIYKDMYFLSIPGIDYSFVYFINDDAWCQYDKKIWMSITYKDSSILGVSDNFYFMSDDSALYTFSKPNSFLNAEYQMKGLLKSSEFMIPSSIEFWGDIPYYGKPDTLCPRLRFYVTTNGPNILDLSLSLPDAEDGFWDAHAVFNKPYKSAYFPQLREVSPNVFLNVNRPPLHSLCLAINWRNHSHQTTKPTLNEEVWRDKITQMQITVKSIGISNDSADIYKLPTE